MKTHLFDFATKRNPQLIDEDDKKKFYVLLTPEILSSTHYYQNLRSDQFIGVKQEIRGRSRTFGNLLSLQDLKNNHKGLLRFYRSFRSESFRASFNGLKPVVSEIQLQPLNATEKAVLWDNFVHYLWVNPQEHEIEIISAILVADKMVTTLVEIGVNGDPLTENQEKALRRLVKADIVLPISIENKVPNSSPPQLSRRQKLMLETAHNRFISVIQKEELNKARIEIRSVVDQIEIESQNKARVDQLNKESKLVETLNTLELGNLRERVLPLTRSNQRVTKQPVAIETVRNKLSKESVSVLERFKDNKTNEVELAVLNLNRHEENLNLQTIEPITASFITSYVAFGAEITYEEKIPPGSIIVKATPNGLNTYNYYLTYYHNGQRPRLLGLSGTISVANINQEINGARLAIQHPAFQSFKLNDEPLDGIRVEINMTLSFADTGGSQTSLPGFELIETIPHFDVPTINELDDFAAQPPPLFGVNKLGIMDFRRVEQELTCYVMGEVSLIQNIMASSYQEKVSRSLTVQENEEELTNESSAEHQSDTEIAEKLEQQKTVNEVINEEKSSSFDVGAGVSAEIGKVVTLTTNFNANFNSSSSRENSNTEALNYAKSVTNKIQNKIAQKTTARRRSLVRHEFENTHKHGFDNRQGTDHVVGVYRWLDKIYDNFLVNYGRRSIIEWEIPEPARNFIRTQDKTAKTDDFKKTRPKPPSASGLLSPNGVTRTNYLWFASRYRLSIPEPPAESLTIGRAFADTPFASGNNTDNPEDFNRSAAYNEIEVPDGYLAKKAVVYQVADGLTVEVNTNLGKFNAVGGIVVSVAASNLENDLEQEIALPDLTGIVPISVYVNAAKSYVVNMVIECELDRRVYNTWQLQTYNAIVSAYKKELADYESALEEHKANQEKADLNPRFKRQLMERELKRLCIEMITRPFSNIDISADHYQPADEEDLFDTMILSPALDKHASIVKFFEQAFDWHLMAYIYYPYFYADEKTWSVKLAMEVSSDKVFESFLTSGMGRVEVPIRKGFEKAVMYYLQTGEVWFGGGFVLDVKNDLYLSIADELNTADEEFTIEKTWQTKLPTNLTILQSRAAALAEEGLPCKIEANKIGVGSSSLNPVISPSGTPS